VARWKRTSEFRKSGKLREPLEDEGLPKEIGGPGNIGKGEDEEESDTECIYLDEYPERMTKSMIEGPVYKRNDTKAATIASIREREKERNKKRPRKSQQHSSEETNDGSEWGTDKSAYYDEYLDNWSDTQFTLEEGDDRTFLALMSDRKVHETDPKVVQAREDRITQLRRLFGDKSTVIKRPPKSIPGDLDNRMWKWIQELNCQPKTERFKMRMGRRRNERQGFGTSRDKGLTKDQMEKEIDRNRKIMAELRASRNQERDIHDPAKEIEKPVEEREERRLSKYNQKQLKAYLKDMMEKHWGTRKLPRATIAYIWHRNYSPSPIVEMYVEGIGPKRVLLDSGAGVSLISTAWFKEVMAQWKDDEAELRYEGPAWDLGGITGPDLPTMGKYKLIFQINDSSFPIRIAISDDPAAEMDYRIKNIDAILGMNFLLKYKVVLDFAERVIHIGKQTISYVNERPELEETMSIGALTLNPKPMVLKKDQEAENDFECEEFEIKNNIKLKPSACSWFMFYSTKRAKEDLVIPNQIVAPGIVVLKSIWNEDQNRVWLGIRNEMTEEVEIKEETRVWIQVKKLAEDEKPKAYIGALIQDPEVDRFSKAYQEEWKGVRDEVVERATELDDQEKDKLKVVFEEFFDIMRLKYEAPGEVKSYEVEIELTKYEPIYVRPYSLSDVIHKEIDRQIGVMLKHKIIRPSVSEWNFPIVAVKKKILDLQHDQIHDIRMCIDFRPLNLVTKPMTWPIPTIEDTLRRLGGSKYFTTLDVLSGFMHLPIKEQHRKFLAFATKLAHYEFCRMPFGWQNSPFHFQRYMQTRIADRNKECCQVYIDDIIINSDTKEEHFEHIRRVLRILAEEGVYLKMMKISAFQPQLEYLGHIISREGIRKDPKKVEAILKCKDPINKKQVRQILGKANYLGKFIANMADITGPMSKVTSSSDKVPFVWGEEQKQALRRLKEAVVKDVMLAFPDPNKPYNITTDASDYAVSGVLSQTDEKTKIERPIMFMSRSLDETQRRYTVTEKELYAIIYSLEKCRPYIYGRRFFIYTDHRALIWLCGKKNPMSRVGRWSMQIAEYASGINFIAGKQNRVADALSRAPYADEPILGPMGDYQGNELLPEHLKEQVAKMVGIDPQELQKNEEAMWEKAKECEAKLQGLEWDVRNKRTIAGLVKKSATEWFPTLTPKYWAQRTDPKDIPINVYRDAEGVLWEKGENIIPHQVKVLWVPPAFRRDIMRAFHHTPLSAHPSGLKMYLRMKYHVAWKGMKNDVLEYVRCCAICQKNRFGLREKPEYQSRGKPERPMQRISMDILSLEGVKASGPCNVLVMVDEFTRYAETYPIKNMEAETVADKLVEEFICRYGIPEEILTDRGANFMSDLFLELCRQLKIQKLNTTAYHPETNGANERMHGTLYTILRALTIPDGKDWKRQLPMAMFVYRNMAHKSTGLSPHQALFGYTSRHECIDEELVETTFPLDERVRALYDMREHIQTRMEQVERENHEKANLKRSIRSYEPGDKVLLRNHVRHKLQTPWRGPYTIINRIGNVNYEIQIPQGDRTHKVFHVQHLKPWITPRDDELRSIEEEDELPELVDISPKKKEEKQEEIQTPEESGRAEPIDEMPDPRTMRPITRAYAKKLDNPPTSPT